MSGSGSPDVVVVEIPFSGWSKTAFEVVSAVKGAKKDAIVALMGQHPTARPEACLSERGVDFVVIGEPRVTVSILVDALRLAGKQDFKGIDGLGFKENGKATITGKREFIKDLDSLPFPARHLLPMGTQPSCQRKPAQRRNKQALDHRHHYQRLPLQLRLLLGLHTLGKNLAGKKSKERG